MRNFANVHHIGAAGHTNLSCLTAVMYLALLTFSDTQMANRACEVHDKQTMYVKTIQMTEQSEGQSELAMKPARLMAGLLVGLVLGLVNVTEQAK